MKDTCCRSHFGRLAAVSTSLRDNEISEISVHRHPGFISVNYSVNYSNYSIINYGYVNCFKNIILCESRGKKTHSPITLLCVSARFPPSLDAPTLAYLRTTPEMGRPPGRSPAEFFRQGLKDSSSGQRRTPHLVSPCTPL